MGITDWIYDKTPTQWSEAHLLIDGETYSVSRFRRRGKYFTFYTRKGFSGPREEHVIPSNNIFRGKPYTEKANGHTYQLLPNEPYEVETLMDHNLYFIDE